MLIELKRCNSIGNIAGLLFVIRMVMNRDSITFSEVVNRCALEMDIIINCNGAIAFLDYLELVERNGNDISVTQELQQISKQSDDFIIKELAKKCITALTNDGVFDENGMCFDPDKGNLEIRSSAFPLAYAAIRNFLIMSHVLSIGYSGEMPVSEPYEYDFLYEIRARRKKITIEQLIKKQEEEYRRGIEAEEYVLNLERVRLPNKAAQIKRISDIDVAAGYDIVSYNENGSETHDRFIEVKCFLGKPHFYWSRNEVDVARIIGERYVLCLVDYSKMNITGYVPEFFENPYDTIYKDDGWLVEPETYKVQRV